MRALAATLILVGACGGYTAVDVDAQTDSIRLGMQIEWACVGDGGMCTASQVRALERATICTQTAELWRHRKPAPDAGIACAPP